MSETKSKECWGKALRATDGTTDAAFLLPAPPVRTPCWQKELAAPLSPASPGNRFSRRQPPQPPFRLPLCRPPCRPLLSVARPLEALGLAFSTSCMSSTPRPTSSPPMIHLSVIHHHSHRPPRTVRSACCRRGGPWSSCTIWGNKQERKPHYALRCTDGCSLRGSLRSNVNAIAFAHG